MAIPLIVGGALMAAGLIGGASSRKSKNKKISNAIKKSPKYKISEEAYANQNLAKGRAFGRDRATQLAMENVDKDAADATSEATMVSNNTNDVLSAISAIQANKNASKRQLSAQESDIRRQNMSELYAANMAMVDEKDKQFMQNEVAPWDANLRHLQARKEEANSAWGNLFSAGSQVFAMGKGGGK